MKQYLFRVDISYSNYLQHYSGAASHIVVLTDQGISLQIPALRFRPYLSQVGLKGRFRLLTDEQNKFVRLEQL